MKELDCVKVIKLFCKNRSFDGTETVKCPAKIGDVAAIVHLQENFCIVEKVDSDGFTVWLADFLFEELEVI